MAARRNRLFTLVLVLLACALWAASPWHRVTEPPESGPEPPLHRDLDLLVRRLPGCFGPEPFEVRLSTRALGTGEWKAILQDEGQEFTSSGTLERIRMQTVLHDLEAAGLWETEPVPKSGVLTIVNGPESWYYKVESGGRNHSGHWTGGTSPFRARLEAEFERGVFADALAAVERERDAFVQEHGAWTSIRLPGGRPERLLPRLRHQFPEVEFGEIDESWLWFRAPDPHPSRLQEYVDDLTRRWSR